MWACSCHKGSYQRVLEANLLFVTGHEALDQGLPHCTSTRGSQPCQGAIPVPRSSTVGENNSSEWLTPEPGFPEGTLDASQVRPPLGLHSTAWCCVQAGHQGLGCPLRRASLSRQANPGLLSLHQEDGAQKGAKGMLGYFLPMLVCLKSHRTRRYASDLVRYAGCNHLPDHSWPRLPKQKSNREGNF